MVIMFFSLGSWLLLSGDMMGMFIGLLALLLSSSKLMLSSSWGICNESWWLLVISWMILGGVYFMTKKTLYSLILFSLSLYFMSLELMKFFIFFELSIMPMFMVIYSYGYSPERLEALYYLGMYSLMGSMPLLMLVFSLGGGVVNGYLLGISFMKMWIFLKKGKWMLILFSLSFMIKMAVFGFHLWLPKVHVEASTEGSMMLAALLLKMGMWGFCYLKVGLGMHWFYELLMILGSVFLVLLVLSGLVCWVSSDSKVYVAYSSINHMTMLMFVLFLLKKWSMDSVMMVALAHAYISSSMFCFVGTLGKYFGNRNLYNDYGMMLISGLGSCLMGLMIFFKCSTPPSLNFVGEITLVYGLLYFFGIGGFLSVLMNSIMLGLLMVYLYVMFWHSKTSKWLNFSFNQCYMMMFFNLLWCISGVWVIGSII